MGNQCQACDSCDTQERVFADAGVPAEDMVLVQDQNIKILQSARRMVQEDQLNSPNVDLPRLKLGKSSSINIALLESADLKGDHKEKRVKMVPDNSSSEEPPVIPPEMNLLVPRSQSLYNPEQMESKESRLLLPGVTAAQHKKMVPVDMAPGGTESAESTATHVEVTFESEDGIAHKVQIFKRPLGVEFSKSKNAPTKVTKVHSCGYASRLGIAIGWSIKSIDGEDMTGKSFAYTEGTLKKSLMVLPLARP